MMLRGWWVKIWFIVKNLDFKLCIELAVVFNYEPICFPFPPPLQHHLASGVPYDFKGVVVGCTNNF